MFRHDRRLRYGVPIATVIVGVLFAAADTHRLGNTVATVLIAAGLVWFMVNVGRDMGMSETGGRRARVPEPPPGPDEPPAEASRRNGGQPPTSSS